MQDFFLSFLGGLVIYVFWAGRARAESSAARALARIEAKLDALLKHAQITYDPFENAGNGIQMDAVLAALKDNNKINAVKLYRQATGVTLSEAYKVVTALRNRLPLP